MEVKYRLIHIILIYIFYDITNHDIKVSLYSTVYNGCFTNRQIN